MTRRILAWAAVGLLALGMLTACNAQGTGVKAYIDGGGVVNEIKPAERVPIGAIAGPQVGGGKLDLADYRGKVVVLNLWWSQCPPCRAEQPMLVAAAKQMTSEGVAFLGINTRDASQSGPLAYQRAYDVPYPSIFDPDGTTLLAFKAYVSPNAIPSTLVIDKEGRVASVVLGKVPSLTTLDELVQDAGGPSTPKGNA